MKERKKIILEIIIVLIVFLLGLGIGYLCYKPANKHQDGDYMTRGEYYLFFVKEQNMYSPDDEEDYDSDEEESIAAFTMYDYYLIEEEQMKNLNLPVTREIVAQSMVNSMEFRTEHNIEISDIKDCVDKQAIIDAVGMGIFELENGKFNPNKAMTKQEVEKALEKMIDIELNSHYPESDWGDDPIKWSDLKITLNKKEFQITDDLKVSDFVNNGWEITLGKELLNLTMEQVAESIADSDTIYIGYNYITLEQDNLSLSLYFDMSSPSTKVIDSKVVAISVYKTDENKKSDLDFYGLKLGEVMTEKQYKQIFGEDNFEIVSDDTSYIYRTLVELDNNFRAEIVILTNLKTNELYNISISRN